MQKKRPKSISTWFNIPLIDTFFSSYKGFTKKLYSEFCIKAFNKFLQKTFRKHLMENVAQFKYFKRIKRYRISEIWD